MPVEVINHIEIARPRAVVAAYAMEPDHAPEWYKNIKSVEWRTEKPLQLGSKLDFAASFLGRRLAYTYEVVDLVPGKKLVMRTSEGPFPMETSYEFADAGAGSTIMSLSNRGEPRGFAGVLSAVMAKAMDRANKADLAEIKRILENRG